MQRTAKTENKAKESSFTLSLSLSLSLCVCLLVKTESWQVAIQSVLRNIFRKDISGVQSTQNLTHANHAGHDKFLHVKKPKVHMLRFAGCSKTRNDALANVAVSADKNVRFLEKLGFFNQEANEKRVSNSGADCVKFCFSRRQGNGRLRTTARKDVAAPKNKKRNTGS